MDWSVVSPYVSVLIHAVLLTIALTALVLLLSTLLGIPLGVIRYAGGRYGRACLVFSWVCRAIPSLVLLLVIFYGFGQLGWLVGGFATAAVALSVQSSGYNLEIVAGGLRSVDERQLAAGRALGASGIRIWVNLILPQALPAIVPPYINNALWILKGTSIASLVTVTELTGATNNLIGVTFQPFPFLILNMIIYLMLATVLVGIQRLLERATSLGRRPRRALRMGNPTSKSRMEHSHVLE